MNKIPDFLPVPPPPPPPRFRSQSSKKYNWKQKILVLFVGSVSGVSILSGIGVNIPQSEYKVERLNYMAPTEALARANNKKCSQSSCQQICFS